MNNQAYYEVASRAIPIHWASAGGLSAPVGNSGVGSATMGFDNASAVPPKQSLRKSKYVPRSLAQHNYRDRSRELPDGADYITRGGVATLFPLKLHQTIDRMCAEGHGHIMSWQPHGRAFLVHKPREFEQMMHRYFGKMKFSSFQRQLNLYGFMRLTHGPDKGGYYHELFLRGRGYLCHRIQRIRVKGTGARSASNPDQEPNFYAMPPVGCAPLPPTPQTMQATVASGVVERGHAPPAMIALAQPTMAALSSLSPTLPVAAPKLPMPAGGLPPMGQRCLLPRKVSHREDELTEPSENPVQQQAALPQRALLPKQVSLREEDLRKMLVKPASVAPRATPSESVGAALAVEPVPDADLDDSFWNSMEIFMDKFEEPRALSSDVGPTVVVSAEGKENEEEQKQQPEIVKRELKSPARPAASGCRMSGSPSQIRETGASAALPIDGDVADFLRSLFEKDADTGAAPSKTTQAEAKDSIQVGGSWNAASFKRHGAFKKQNSWRNAAA